MTDSPPDITLTLDEAVQIVEALSSSWIYTLLGSEDADEHLPEDFKPHKWEGFELQQAEKEVAAYRLLIQKWKDANDISD